MAEERQPPNVVEGATAGDVEDEVQQTAKTAEDRKAAAALASLDSAPRDDDGAGAKDVDQEAVSKAMKGLSVGGHGAGKPAEVAKKVKVDPADVTLVVSSSKAQVSHVAFYESILTSRLFLQVEELDLTKAKATELLKQHDGDAVKAMRAFIAVS